MNNVMSMLGSFLEFATGVDPIAPALEFYRSLGFQELPTGDLLDSPYTAVWDGNVVVGLHRTEAPAALRFVRPDLRLHARALKRVKIAIESAELGDDAFNEIVFHDDSGTRVELVEARTFSPAERDGGVIAACGEFAEISLPTDSIREAAAFWSQLGFELIDVAGSPNRRIRLRGCGCTVGFHEARILPGLSFAAADLRARSAFLSAHGHRSIQGPTPRLSDSDAIAFAAPGGTAIYLHASR
jgi:hypothetical protein